MSILDPIMSAGPLFMIFIVFTVIGLVVRLGFLSAVRNGLMIAVGFNGVYIVVDYFLARLRPQLKHWQPVSVASSPIPTSVGLLSLHLPGAPLGRT